MEKLDENFGKSEDIIANNIEQLKQLFPEAFTEGRIDFEVLKQLLGEYIDTNEEKYGLNWFGKKKARQFALTPSLGTLRPCPEKSVDWETTKNIMIEGDNLEVLKLLQKSYSNKIKLIYIDPPYNTGSDFVYNDNYSDSIKHYKEITGQLSDGVTITSNVESSGRYHTNWLNMMLPRLTIARNLLRDDGLIMISIDDHELHNLLSICNQLFGTENYIATQVWQKKTSGGQHSSTFLDFHEYIVTYAKNIESLTELRISRSEKQESSFTMVDEYQSERGKYLLSPLKSWLDERKTLIYPIQCPDGSFLKTQWICSQPTFEQLKKEGRIQFKQNSKGEWAIYKKQYSQENDGKIKPPSLITDLAYTANGKRDIKDVFNDFDVFSFPKPVKLMKYLCEMATNGNDIILDFFAGSGTMAQAVMELNQSDGESRRFIMVQLPELIADSKSQNDGAAGYFSDQSNPINVADICIERIRQTGNRIREHNNIHSIDTGFRVFILDSSNIKAWDPSVLDVESNIEEFIEYIKPDRSEEDILFELLLKFGLDLAVQIESRDIANKQVYNVGFGVLLVCLATNITNKEIEPLALGMIEWIKEQNPEAETTIVFRDSAFADDVAKTNITAIFNQYGFLNIRSL
jgi:adenine-specific DNA-methyltransferase